MRQRYGRDPILFAVGTINPKQPEKKPSTEVQEIMASAQIESFAQQAVIDPTLQEKLKTCERVKELTALAKEYGFNFAEEELYPPNEPSFKADQLHPRLVKALLR